MVTQVLWRPLPISPLASQPSPSGQKACLGWPCRFSSHRPHGARTRQKATHSESEHRPCTRLCPAAWASVASSYHTGHGDLPPPGGPDQPTHLGQPHQARGRLCVPHVRLAGPDEQGFSPGGAQASGNAIQLLGVADLRECMVGKGVSGLPSAPNVGVGVGVASPWCLCRGLQCTQGTQGSTQPARTGSV